MTLSSEQLKLIERYMDASEKMQPILKKGFNAMLLGARAEDVEATQAGLKETIEDMKQFKDIMNIDVSTEVHQIIEQESGLKFLDVPAFVTSASNWESLEKGLKWIINKDADRIRFGDVAAEIATLKYTIDGLPQAVKWLEDFLLNASQEAGKSYRTSAAKNIQGAESAVAIVEDIQERLVSIAAAVNGRASGDPVAAGDQLKQLLEDITEENISGGRDLTVQAGAYINGLRQRVNTLSLMMMDDPNRFSNKKWSELILSLAIKDAEELLGEVKRVSLMAAEVGTPALLEDLKDLAEMVRGGAIYPDDIKNKVIPAFELVANDEETPAGIRNLLNKAIENLEALLPHFGSAAGSAGDRLIEKLWGEVKGNVEKAIIRLNKGGVKTGFPRKMRI